MALPVLRGERLTLRPLREDDLDRLLAIVREPSVAQWWGSLEDAREVRADFWRDGLAFAVEADGELAGWLGLSEESSADYRHASIDVMLAPAFQDRGIGSEALRLAIGWLLGERGHHRITIDPAAENARAVRAYERVGFRRVGVMHAYERGADGTWHDNVLMELVKVAPTLT
jgi:aminoglycoside 6'-N-acetyltransferase